MMLDSIEQSSLKLDNFEYDSKMRELNKSFDTSFEAINGFLDKLSPTADKSISNWLGISVSDVSSENRASIYQGIRNMFTGVGEGESKTLGIDEISSWKINPQYKHSNIKQHAGYAAEVISTTKENMLAELKGTGEVTVRTDDLAKTNPDCGFKVNDPYVDKVRYYSDGSVERIQTKFVGKNADECLSKLASSKYEKYRDTTKVDKIEIPKDYYDSIKGELLPEKISKLEEQVAKAESLGKTDVVETKQAELAKYQQIDSMIEKSVVSSKEAELAVSHPKTYKAMALAPDVALSGNSEGLKTGKQAAMITFAVSTVDNVSQIIDGEIEVDEAVANIVTETGTAAIIGYGTGFAEGALRTVMKESSSKLMNKVGNSCLPAAVVSFGVESYDDISAFARGEIDAGELAYNLGENAADVAGSCVGGAVGAAVGGVAGPIGSVAGSVVGGTVGCAIAVEAYHTAVELGAEGAEIIAEKAQELAANVVDTVSEVVPEALSDVKNAFAEFASNVNLPFSLG
ncbi:MAG: hypothetical protein MSH60_12045 [Ruminococcus sp.]|nr:hypothetical protein [Ruminococcus sp.]